MAEGQNNDRGLGLHRQKDRDGNTPLHVAARAGDTDVIRAFLTLGTEGLEERNARGQTPLYLAVLSGNKEGVECLLEVGADPNTEADDGSNIWHAAASSGSTDIIKMITSASVASKLSRDSQERKTAANDHGASKMKNGSVNDSEKKSNTLSSKAQLSDKDIDSFNKSDIRSKPVDGMQKPSKWEEVYKKANNISSSSDSDNEFSSDCLFKKRKSKKKNLVSRNMSEKIEDCEHEMNFLKMICNNISRSFIDKNKRSSLLLDAARVEAEECVENILKYKVDVNVVGENGATAFMFASMSGSTKIMDMLLEAGADYKHVDDFGRTALHIAANWKRLEAVKKLLALGLDPNQQCNGGMTPLHSAVIIDGNFAVVEELIKYGANRFIQDNSGVTPFDLVIFKNGMNMPLPIESGIDG